MIEVITKTISYTAYVEAKDVEEAAELACLNEVYDMTAPEEVDARTEDLHVDQRERIERI